MDFVLIVHVPTPILHVILVEFVLPTFGNGIPKQTANDSSNNLSHNRFAFVTLDTRPLRAVTLEQKRTFHPMRPRSHLFSAIYTQRSPLLTYSATGYLLSLALIRIFAPVSCALSHATLQVLFCSSRSWFSQSFRAQSLKRFSRSVASHSSAYLSHAFPESGCVVYL